MLEEAMKAVIEELGATGVLLLGLTIIFFHVAREISAPLKIINSEIGEIRDLLEKLVTKLDKK